MKTHITSRFSTGEYHGYNVKFSPFIPNVLACATSENYGIAGTGLLILLDITDPNHIQVIASNKWIDSLFDVTWSELNPNLVVTSSGSGAIQIWDRNNNEKVPVAMYNIHKKEVYGVDWNPKNHFSLILSASWDTTLKLWDPFVGKEINCFKAHADVVYNGLWSPHIPSIFASSSGDATLKLWNIRDKPLPFESIIHPSEVLCFDWCRLNPNLIITGSVDGVIRNWDIRNLNEPVVEITGHEYAIRRLKCAHHKENVIGTVSYDFTTKFWDITKPYPVQVHNSHTEFVYGLDFDPLKLGQVSDCSWDGTINVYNEVQA